MQPVDPARSILVTLAIRVSGVCDSEVQGNSTRRLLTFFIGEGIHGTYRQSVRQQQVVRRRHSLIRAGVTGCMLTACVAEE